MPALIPLTHGKAAFVSEEDYQTLSQHRWIARKSTTDRKWYAVRIIRENGRQVGVRYMHREIMKAPRGILVDHINGDGLDNRRDNLRFATHTQNNAAAKPRNGKKLKGVSLSRGKWQAEIAVHGRRIYLGRFDSQLDAILAYNNAATELHGDFAFLNPLPTHE
jgi:hypothetical protein